MSLLRGLPRLLKLSEQHFRVAPEPVMAQRTQKMDRASQRADLDRLAADMDMNGVGSELGYGKRHGADPPKARPLLLVGRLEPLQPTAFA
ncbi:hypothetical protein GCM10017653_24600 [Ancylobacter defluvii]|uniref:Uncharacterized protein n=1 Tax=Ancylobacter defluvii TaxID=1282440 RepID=A0A9W6JV09_9HYPH|nr:hypothetical protein GCM10017653_24600 [Ancylobacter defluvii]